MNTIDWRTGQYTSHNGFVGPLHLFTYAWKSTRDDPNWVLSCVLPGLEGKRWKHDDESKLREQAAVVLRDWLRKVFGIQPADQEDTAFRTWYEHGATDIGPDLEWCAVEGFEAGWRARAGEQATS